MQYLMQYVVTSKASILFPVVLLFPRLPKMPQLQLSE